MAKKKKETQVATKQETALSKPEDRRGHEEPSRQEDFIIPRAALLQKTSPLLDQYSELKPGMIVNSLTGEILPAEFIPITKRTYWVRFNPRDAKDPNYLPEFAPGAIVWKSDNPNDPKVLRDGEFGPNGEKPAATKFLSFLAHFSGHDMPVVIAFSKTSFNTGRALNTLTKTAPGPMFASKYTLSAIKKENDKGVFFVFKVNKAGQSSDEEFKTAEQFYKQFADVQDLKFHDEEETTPEGESAEEKVF